MINQFKAAVKKRFLELSGLVDHFKIKIECNSLWYGNQYGGFYVCPDLINHNSVVYSFGIGEDMSFDFEIISQHGCTVYGFDPTPKSIRWVMEQHTPDSFCFYNFGLSNYSGETSFYLPKNSSYVSGSTLVQKNVNFENKVSVEMKTLPDIAKMLGHSHIDVLKMDIEGSEYEVIDSILDSNISINQILIEFHDRFISDGRNKTINIVNKLEKNGYSVFAVSKSYEEVSFIKRNLL